MVKLIRNNFINENYLLIKDNKLFLDYVDQSSNYNTISYCGSLIMSMIINIFSQAEVT